MILDGEAGRTTKHYFRTSRSGIIPTALLQRRDYDSKEMPQVSG